MKTLVNIQKRFYFPITSKKPKANPVVFIDFKIGKNNSERIHIEVYFYLKYIAINKY